MPMLTSDVYSQWTRRTALGGVLSSAVIAASARAQVTTAGRIITTGSDVLVTGGWAVIPDRMVVDGVLTIAPGSGLRLPAGSRLQVRGDLVAPAVQVFQGPGEVDLMASAVLAARPEWWGALRGNGNANCAPAIAAALRAHLTVALAAGDYFIDDAVVMDLHNRTLFGMGLTKDAGGTRLVLKRNTGSVLQMGTLATPSGGINSYVRGLRLSNLELSRWATPISDDWSIEPGGPTGRATGLLIRHVLDARCERIRSQEQSIGYDIKGAVHSILEDCMANRSIPPSTRTAPGKPTGFIGFRMDGRNPPISTGANASLYLIDCCAGMNNMSMVPGSAGCLMLGAVSDTTLQRFETVTFETGIIIDGTGKDDLGTQTNIHIDTPVLDACFGAGIVLRGLGKTAMLDMRSPYVGLAAGDGTAIKVERCVGAVTITGGQLVIPGGGSRGSGMDIADSSGLSVFGLKMLNMSEPVRAARVVGVELDISVNPAGRDYAAPVVTLKSADQVKVTLGLAGNSGRYRLGLDVDRTSKGIEFDAAKLSAARFSEGLVTDRSSLRRQGSRWLSPE